MPFQPISKSKPQFLWNEDSLDFNDKNNDNLVMRQSEVKVNLYPSIHCSPPLVQTRWAIKHGCAVELETNDGKMVCVEYNEAQKKFKILYIYDNDKVGKLIPDEFGSYEAEK